MDFDDAARRFGDEAVRESVDAAERTIRATPYSWRDPSTIPLRPWLFGYWLLRRALACVFAAGGLGKTRLIVAVALSLATGRNLIGKSVWGERRRVWIWNLEDEREELERDIQAACLHYAIKPADLDGQLFVDTAMEGAGLCTAVMGAAGFTIIEPVIEAIVAELGEREIDMLVIDPFVSSHEIDENANVYIDKVAKAWGKVAKRADACIVLVHHTVKMPPGVRATANSGRGASALKDAARMALVLNKMETEEAKRLGVESGDRWRYFSVQDDKHNRAPAEDADWYRLESVYLGNGGIQGGDSVGVVTAWTPPDPFDGVTTPDLARVQLMIAEGGWRKDSRAERWAGIAVAEAMGLDAEEEIDRARIKALLKQWIKAGALREIDEKDDTRQMRKFVVVGHPATV